MKTILFSGGDETYAPLSILTVPLMQRYADRHGYTFRFHSEPLIDVPNGIYWTGVCGALKAIEDGYDKIVYLDCDQQITNMDFEFPGWTKGFHVCRDWGEDATHPRLFSACGFMAHPESETFLREVLGMEPDWQHKGFPEQGPMREAAERFRYIYRHERRPFNAVPSEVCPGKVPEPWVKGDFAAHLTMLPIDERVKLFHEIQKQL